MAIITLNGNPVASGNPFPVSSAQPSDLSPATQSITAADAASSVAAGYNNQVIVTGTPTAGSVAAFAISTAESANVQLTGTFLGTVYSEYSIDGGITWTRLTLRMPGVANSSSSFNAFPVLGVGLLAGRTNFRIRCGTYTSGTLTVRITTSNGNAVVYTAGSSTIADPALANAANVKAANTAVAASDSPLAVGLHPTSPLPAGTNALGSVSLASGTAVGIAAGSAAIGSVTVSNFPSGQATAANQSTEITALQQIATNTGASSVDFTTSGTIAATNGAVSITGQGVYSITASITGTWAATLVAEGQLADNTWVVIPIYPITASLPYASTFSATANGSFVIICGGFLNVRIRASAYTSGTVNVALDASLSQQATYAVQQGVWGMRAQDGAGNALASSNAPPAGTEQGLIVRSIAYNVDGYRPSYSAGIAGLAPASTPTDVFTIFGSATKTIRVTRISFNATQTTAGSAIFLLLKRSTANSAGTALAATPHDSGSAAATATVNSYTANPGTLGTQVGSSLRAQRATVGTTTLASGEDNITWDFGVRPSQAIVLRGVAQCLSINLNGVTLTGGLMNIYCEWTEDNS